MDKFKYNGILFQDKLEFLLYLVKINNNKFKLGWFWHSNIYYCRAALEEKFKKKFSLKETRELIQDMPQTSASFRDDLGKLLMVHRVKVPKQ